MASKSSRQTQVTAVGLIFSLSPAVAAMPVLASGGNRLLVFARKPAPVEGDVPGLPWHHRPAGPADYYLTNAHADPPGPAQAHDRVLL
ncbi:MAG TPA: hypothetical protein VG125_17535 [Pirellulales bacterium]|nr:hypothetical protein [Pirellulales bacterium]